VIGDVSSHVIPQATLQVNARKVTLSWQRVFKIDEGRNVLFGKVYIAVNNATGELTAMKEIRLQANDQRESKNEEDKKAGLFVTHQKAVFG